MTSQLISRKLSLTVATLILLMTSTVFAEKEKDWLHVQPGKLPEKDARITYGPTVKKMEDGKWEIMFEVNKPCDVSVSIIDEEGEVVRSLAAGVLGDTAPLPFIKGFLGQILTWDGLDDEGKKVVARQLKVRVGIGLQAKFDRILGFEPGTLKLTVIGLDVDEKGKLYVLNAGPIMQHPIAYLYCYNRDGSYDRTVIPYNTSGVSVERLRDSLMPLTQYGNKPLVKLANGEILPMACGNFSLNEKWPGMFGYVLIDVSNPDGKPFVRQKNGRFIWRPFNQGKMKTWTTLEKDGLYSVPLRNIPTPDGVDLKYGVAESVRMVADPDDNFYIFGIRRKTGTASKKFYKNAVYKYDGNTYAHLTEFTYSGTIKLEKPVHYIGVPGIGGKEEEHLNEVIAVATQENGNILIAERKGRIKVFRKDGLYLSEFALPFDEIGNLSCGRFSPKKDIAYVLGLKKEQRYKWTAHAAKLRLSDQKIIWQTPLPRLLKTAGALTMAVDTSAEPPVIWVGGSKTLRSLGRIEDLGDKFAVSHLQASEEKSTRQPYHIYADVEKDVLFYVDANSATIGRLQISTGKNLKSIESSRYSQWRTTVNMALDRKNKRLLVSAEGYKKIKFFDYDGNLVDGPDLPLGGPTFDRQGNIFIARVMKVFVNINVKKAKEIQKQYHKGGMDPIFRVVNAQVRALVPKEKWLGPPHLVNGRKAARTKKDGTRLTYFAWHIIQKYSPDGKLLDKKYATQLGAREAAAIDSRGFAYAMDSTNYNTHGHGWGHYRRYPFLAHYLIKYEQGGEHGGKGEVWRRQGISPVTHPTCGCGPSGQIVIDKYDRIFVTDGLNHHIKVFDTAGNLISIIGSYGNEDCAGPKSKFPKPEIPLCRPCGVDIAGNTCFIADSNNSRIVQTKLQYKSAKSTELK